jgi:hypothetical protein
MTEKIRKKLREVEAKYHLELIGQTLKTACLARNLKILLRIRLRNMKVK